MDKNQTKIHIINAEGTLLFSNLSEHDIDCFTKCNTSNEIIETIKGKARNGKIQNEYGMVYLISYSKDYCKSSHLFKKEQALIVNILPNFSETKKKAFNEFKHDIPKIHGHNIQEIFSIIPQNEFQKQKSAQDQINFIKNIIESEPEKTARALLKIIKNNSSISNEFTILNSRYTEGYIIQLDSHKIYKVFHNVLVNFFTDFKEKNIFINLDQETDDSVVIDFDTFKAALIPFFDNALKYTYPNNEITISFESTTNYVIVKIEMLSLQIKEDEVKKIINEGVVGEMAKKSGKAGKGLGFTKIIDLLNFSKAKIEISINIKPIAKESLNGLQYEVNQFKFFVKKDNN